MSFHEDAADNLVQNRHAVEQNRNRPEVKLRFPALILVKRPGDLCLDGQ